MYDLILWNTYVNRIPERTLGVYQLSTWLRQHGYRVKILDFCSYYSPEKLAELTEKFISDRTIAIGVSSTFWVWDQDPSIPNTEPKWVYETRTILESKFPNLKWILGGHRSHKRTFKKQWIRFHDYAEDSVLKFLDHSRGLVNQTRDKYDIVNHEGFAFQKEDIITPYEVLPIELSRGCRFECSFCRFPLLGKTPGTYIRTDKSIREELIRNYNEFGTTNYMMMCDTFNESPEKIQSLHDITQSLSFQINYIAYVRLDLLNARSEQIKLCQDSGLRSAFFGIESFHPTASMAVGKGWNGKKAKDALLKLKEIWGTRTNFHLGFIVGLPGENEESILETNEWCIKNEMPAWRWNSLSLSIAYKDEVKSKFEKDAEKYGYTMTGPNTWKNEFWNSQTAMKMRDKLNDASAPYQHPAQFQATKFINMGYSWDYTLQSKYGTVFESWPDIFERKKNFLQNYYQQQSNQSI